MTGLGPISGYTSNFNLRLVNFDALNWGEYERTNWEIIDGLLYNVIALSNVQGIWENAISVTVGQRYIDDSDGTIWEAQVAHTTASSPTTFSDDRVANPTYWQQLGALIPNYKGAWANDAIYSKNDFVSTDDHRYAVCVTSHTASSAPNTIDDDIGNWEVLVDLGSTVTAAETAETNAETAETNAAASESAASTSEANAAASESAAATSETNAAASESAAATSEANAAASESAAATSEANAAASESAAGTSETNAAASEAKAADWAEEDEDVAVEPGQFSAKHHAAKAAVSAASVETALDKTAVIRVISVDTSLVTGDGKEYFVIPAQLDGMNLTDVNAHVFTASSSGTVTVQIHNETDAVDMLSTPIGIAASSNDDSAAVIDAANDDVVVGDVLRFDIDAAGTGTKGLEIAMRFEVP